MSKTVPRKVSPWVVYLAVLLVFFIVLYIVWRREQGGEGLLGGRPGYAYALPEEPKAAVGESGGDSDNGLLRIISLDVGQGDCALVELPDGKLMIVDAGDRDAGPKVRDWLLENRLTNIYCIVATHPHADHIGGFVDILKVIGTDLAYLPGEKSGATTTTKTYRNFLKALDKKNILVKDAYAGDYIVSNSVCVVKVLSPGEHLYEGLNNTSVCLLVLFGDHKALLTGDMEADAEKEVVSLFGPEIRKVNLLKVGHHGSKTSSCEEFLRICEPDVAFISLGRDNEYHHPHPSLMKRLLRWAGAIYRTDQEGTLTFLSDGRQYEVKTAK